MKKTVAVYLSSKVPNTQAGLDAYELGSRLTQRGYQVLFGGRAVGCMGELARGVSESGGRATGFVPERLALEGPLNFDQHRIADESGPDAHPLQRRKYRMFEKADAFVVAPGGLGTLDELAEVMALNQLGYLPLAPVVLLNPDGYWNHLTDHLANAFRLGYIPRDPFRTFLSTAETPEACVASLQRSFDRGTEL